MLNRFRLAFLLYLAATSAVAAEDRIASKEDLLGRWAADCSLPSSASNPYIEFSARDGRFLRTVFTDHQASAYPVRAISFESGTIRLVFGPTDDTVVTVFAEYDPAGSMQTIESFVDRSGQSRRFGIKDRQELTNHREARWIFKCPAAVS